MVRFSSKWGRNPLLARAPVALISPLLLYISATPGAPFDTFKRTQQFVAQNTVFQGEQPGFRCEKFTSASNRKTVLCVAFQRRLLPDEFISQASASTFTVDFQQSKALIENPEWKNRLRKHR